MLKEKLVALRQAAAKAGSTVTYCDRVGFSAMVEPLKVGEPNAVPV